MTDAERSPLIEAVELKARIAQPGLRIVDVRWYLNREGAGRAAYETGHIPGAVFMDLDTDLSDHDGYGSPGRHPLPPAQEFARRMGRLGIGSDDFVVAYDESGGAIAARLWWMLDNLGHRGGVAVLNGGIQAWSAAGYELDGTEPAVEPALLELAGEWRNTIDRVELAGRLGDLTLVDARAPERYRGEVEPIDPIAGHIPTAVNLPTTENMDETGRFRPADSLRTAYAALQDSDRPVVVSCGSGTTACHSVIAMRLAGLPEPLLYVGSFSDWSRSVMPVVTGAEPGTVEKSAAAR